MSVIKEFDAPADPQLADMMHRHHAWHVNPSDTLLPSTNPSEIPDANHPRRKQDQGQPGSGLDFLNFHRDFVEEFFDWNQRARSQNPSAGADPRELEAWTEIPPVLRQDRDWNQSLSEAVDRIESDIPLFNSMDAFGIFIEAGVHGWIHKAIGRAIQNNKLPGDTNRVWTEDKIIMDFHSPQSTYFYQLHGLIQYWRNHWRWLRHGAQFSLWPSLGEYLFRRRFLPIPHAGGVEALSNGKVHVFPPRGPAHEILNCLVIFETGGDMESKPLGRQFREKAMTSVIELAQAELEKMKLVSTDAVTRVGN